MTAWAGIRWKCAMVHGTPARNAGSGAELAESAGSDNALIKRLTDSGRLFPFDLLIEQLVH